MGTGSSHNSYYMHSTLLAKSGITVSGSKTLLNSVWEKQTQEVRALGSCKIMIEEVFRVALLFVSTQLT